MLNKVTGTEGVNPIQDSSFRAIIFAALTQALSFVNDKSDFLTDGDVVTLTPVLVAVAFVIAGVWDRFRK